MTFDKVFKRIAAHINRIPVYGFVIVLISINKLSWHLIGNEENYFAWARQFADPAWFPGSFVMDEFPGTRLLFQCITGPLLKFIPFEVVALFGRLLLIVLISWPISKISKHFNLENVTLFIVLQLFFINDQTFFAGSLMIGTFQASSISWTISIFAIYYLLIGKKKVTLVYLILATYFHILIGAWVSLAVFIYWLINVRSFKKLLPLAGIYVLSILPFIIYLYNGVFSGQVKEIDGVNLDWIYVYFRNPHHVGLYLSGEYFVKNHLFGVVLTFIFWLLTGFVVPRLNKSEIRDINALNFIALSILLASVVLGAFDRTGWFLKFYPFRLSTLTRLLVSFELMIILKYYLTRPSLKLSLLILATVFFGYKGVRNVNRNMQPFPTQLAELAGFAERETSEGDMFIFLNYPNKEENQAFMRKSHRDRFVSMKFVPAGGEKIYEWYRRIQQREALENNINLLPELAKKYELDYLVSPEPYNVSFLEEVFQNEKYYVFKISVN